MTDQELRDIKDWVENMVVGGHDPTGADFCVSHETSYELAVGVLHLVDEVERLREENAWMRAADENHRP